MKPVDLFRPVFLGWVLHALAKAGGGVRPIAIGMTLPHLVLKAANVWAIHQSAHLLSPCQLGAGAKGGAVAIIHATCAFISSGRFLERL